MQLIAQPNFFKRGHGFCPAISAAGAGDGQRQLHICQHALVRDKVIALKHKADGVVAIGIPVPVKVLFGGDPVDDKVAGVIAVKAAYNV